MNIRSYFNLKWKARPVGILAAMPSEGKKIQEHLSSRQEITINHIKYHIGKWGNLPVVMAVTGIGEVNAAGIAMELAQNFKIKALFLCGIAGGVASGINIGDVVIGNELVALESCKDPNISKDMLNPFNHELTPSSLPLTKPLLDTLNEMDFKEFSFNVHLGKIATTNIYPPSEEEIASLNQLQAYAVDMEGYSIAEVAWLHRLPFMVIRAISDCVNQVENLNIDTYDKTSSESKNKPNVEQHFINVLEKILLEKI